MRTILAVSISLVLGALLSAQNSPSDQELIAALQKLDARVFKPDSPDLKLRTETLEQLRAEVNRKDVEAWRKIATKEEWEKFRDERLVLLRRSLGTFPEMPKNVKVVTTKKIAGENFFVENILYESRPGLFVSANLYVPARAAKPMPGMIVIHSHHNPKTQGELQDMGMTWARQGCLVLIPDMLGHGERRQHPFENAKSYPEPFKVGRQDYWFRYDVALQLHLVGESLIGWMVGDLMRSVDVLHQRDGIDKSKIVVLGSVAGGGDPCAVLAALDPRVTAAAPFNFGGPQPETRFPLPKDADLHFDYMGSGSWESTRNLRNSGRDGFLPWLIVGAIAPRGLIYGHEFAWDEKNDPVWTRLQKIWGFYDAADKLAFVQGRGSVRGQSPEATHCNNIGPEHRKQIYPTLEKWFGLPIPAKEHQKRFDVRELQCWTEEAKKTLKPKMVHELAAEIADKYASGVLQPKNAARQNLPRRKCKLESVSDELWQGKYRLRKQILRCEGDVVCAVPFMTLLPAGSTDAMPVVIALAQGGKAGFLKHRAETIARLLEDGVAVCFPDLSGTGETCLPGEGRGRASLATSISATQGMLGRTVFSARRMEAVGLSNELPKQGFGAMALWGDSFAEPNDATRNFAVPHDAEKMPRQSEPMGGDLALSIGWPAFLDELRDAAQDFPLGQIKAIYARGGLVSGRTLLETPFCRFPHDAVVPDRLTIGVRNSALAFLGKHPTIRIEAMVDGLNRRVDANTWKKTYASTLEKRTVEKSDDRRIEYFEQASSPAEVAAWLSKQVRK